MKCIAVYGVFVAICTFATLAVGPTVCFACTDEGPCEECGGECEPEEPPACPECGSNENVVPIIYGYPGPELREAAERGEVFLGGCVVTEDAPRWYCKKCERGW